ncbi:MAG: isoleucine--tRNA ligase [Pseudomonadota bacterium]
MSDDRTPERGAEGLDFRKTLFLPQTEFPMRAGLPKREPEWLERWARLDIYKRLKENRRGHVPFVLHDGPPYANGNLHIGHALNKILKDIVIRSRHMMGFDAGYRPGWDCHGLPIEWKVEEAYRANGRNKDDVPINEFRQECRNFAAEWIDIQREEFQRLGITGEWDRPYTTMAFDAEAGIVLELHKFLMNGLLYRGSKPVMWSTLEQTALAEAEVEYHDHRSPTIHVRFPIVKGEGLDGLSVLIWTTTPWTIPGNRAIAYSPRISYGVYEVKQPGEPSRTEPGQRVIVADGLADAVARDANIAHWERLGDAPSLEGAVCAHPLRGQGYDFPVPLIPGDHVTEEQGTGFVHTAPGHGTDDFDVGLRFGIEVPHTVGADGSYYDHVPLFAGLKVIETEGKKAGKDGPANKAVMSALQDAGQLFASGRLDHSYPHSWRSKAPLIFRNTPQWFIAMDQPGEGQNHSLREVALEEIDQVAWVPARARNRIGAMVADRPDWVVSRQRAWGVPLALFVHKQSQEVLKDEAVNARIAKAFAAEGADAWFADGAAERFLAPDYDPSAYEKVDDILDVWFDSGSTHAIVLEADGVSWPADLYLEGSDQHRGWFQSSLLAASGTRGQAPYQSVLTHGFVNDEEGRKMSKSLGNNVAPQDVIKQSGADILRLWVAGADYTEDLRLGPEIIKGSSDAYRRLRNTMRYLLGALAGFTEAERLAPADMPELERWVLHRLTEIDKIVWDGYQAYDFAKVSKTLFTFATNDLSAVYFDIRKDSLYCDRPDALRRRACRTVLDRLFHCLVTWLAPVLPFTMEEVWLNRFPSEDGSVHLQTFPEVPEAWADAALGTKWARVFDIRRVITGALEIERREKRIGSSLEAAPIVHLADKSDRTLIEGLDLAEIAITSGVSIEVGGGPETAFRLPDVPHVSVEPAMAPGRKCERSWRVLPEVGTDPEYPTLSLRDADAVRHYLARHSGEAAE